MKDYVPSISWNISDFFPRKGSVAADGVHPIYAYKKALYYYRELRDVASSKLKERGLSKQRRANLLWKRDRFDKMARRGYEACKFYESKGYYAKYSGYYWASDKEFPKKGDWHLERITHKSVYSQI